MVQLFENIALAHCVLEMAILVKEGLAQHLHCKYFIIASFLYFHDSPKCTSSDGLENLEIFESDPEFSSR